VRAESVQHAIDNSILPKWCLNAIASTAYADGHSGGQSEIDNIEMSLIWDFEESMKKELDKAS
jgi:hypothetical protein